MLRKWLPTQGEPRVRPITHLPHSQGIALRSPGWGGGSAGPLQFFLAPTSSCFTTLNSRSLLLTHLPSLPWTALSDPQQGNHASTCSTLAPFEGWRLKAEMRPQATLASGLDTTPEIWEGAKEEILIGWECMVLEEGLRAWGLGGGAVLIGERDWSSRSFHDIHDIHVILATAGE